MNIHHKSPHASGRTAEWRGNTLEQPFPWEGSWFQVDTESQAGIARRALVVLKQVALGRETVSVKWRTQDNRFHTFTAEEFLAFAEAVDNHNETVMEAGWRLKDTAT